MTEKVGDNEQTFSIFALYDKIVTSKIFISALLIIGLLNIILGKNIMQVILGAALLLSGYFIVEQKFKKYFDKKAEMK